MSRPLEYVEVLLTGKDSPCYEEAYIIVSDGENAERVTRSKATQVFEERLHGFSLVHGDDHRAMVEKVRNRGIVKWVAGPGGNVIFDMLCVTEKVEAAIDAEVKVAPAKAAVTERAQAAPVQKRVEITIAAQPEAAVVQPRRLAPAVAPAAAPAAAPAVAPVPTQHQACKKKRHCYLRPATPGMTRQLASVKTRAFANGGRLPGHGSCGSYCVSRVPSTNLSAIDIAKNLTLSQLR